MAVYLGAMNRSQAAREIEVKEGLPTGAVERHARHLEVADPLGLIEYSEAAAASLETAQGLTQLLVRRARECLEGDLVRTDKEGDTTIDYQAAVSFSRAAFAGIDLESRLRQRRVEIAMRLKAMRPRGTEDELPSIPHHASAEGMDLLEEETANDVAVTGRAPRRGG